MNNFWQKNVVNLLGVFFYKKRKLRFLIIFDHQQKIYQVSIHATPVNRQPSDVRHPPSAVFSKP